MYIIYNTQIQIIVNPQHTNLEDVLSLKNFNLLIYFLKKLICTTESKQSY